MTALSVPGESRGRPARFSFSEDALTCDWVGSGREPERKVIPFDRVAACLPPDAHELYNLIIFLDEVGEDEHTGDLVSDSDGCKALRIESARLETLPASFLDRFACQLPPYLRSQWSGDLHIVISSKSGTGKAVSFFHKAIEPLLSLLQITDYEVHETESSSTITELAETIFIPQARSGQEQTIILLSGDGGVVDLVRAFASANDQETLQPPTIGLVPMGTGNATANSSQYRDSTCGLSTILRGLPRALNTFKVRVFSNPQPGSVNATESDVGHHHVSELPPSLESAKEETVLHGAVVLSWGLHASLVADSDTPEYRKYGSERFKMIAKELLYPSDGSETHAYGGEVGYTTKDAGTGKLRRINLDENTHMYVLVTLASRLEKDFTISPLSKPMDGQLRLVRFGKVSPDEAMRFMGLAYRGGLHVEEEAVTYEAVESVWIHFYEEDARWRRICVDGQIITVQRDGWLQVERAGGSNLQLISIA